MMASIKISVGQIAITADPRANGASIGAQMLNAREAGARLIHFPEGALSGYSKAQIKDWKDVDWAGIGEELQRIAALAAELQLWVVVGSAHRLTAPNRPMNSRYIIDDLGCLHTRYDKRYCSNSEINDWYTPGRMPVVFDIDGYKFGCALCIGICFPELFAEYEMLDVDCCLISTYSDLVTDAIVAQAYAYVNCIWVSMAAPTQVSRTLPSQIICPNGLPIVTASSKRSDLIFATFDRDEIA